MIKLLCSARDKNTNSIVGIFPCEISYLIMEYIYDCYSLDINVIGYNAKNYLNTYVFNPRLLKCSIRSCFMTKDIFNNKHPTLCKFHGSKKKDNNILIIKNGKYCYL